MMEGEGNGTRAGPEGPFKSAQQQRREYEEALAQLNQPTSMTESQRSRACLDDLKQWVSEMGIDGSNLEEILVQDMIREKKNLSDRGLSPEDATNVKDSKSKYISGGS